MKLTATQRLLLAAEKATCAPSATPEVILLTDAMVYRLVEPDYTHTYCEGVLRADGSREVLSDDMAEWLGWRAE